MERTEMWVAESHNVLQRTFTSDSEKEDDCSLCFETLEGSASFCAQGHNLCTKCKSGLTNCPVCNAEFTGTKNHSAESTISKYEGIKILFDNSDVTVIKNNVGNSIRIGTQTLDMVQKNAHEESPPSPAANRTKEALSVDEVGLSVEGRGKFPCRIGDCTDNMTYSRMIVHIKYLHEESLIDVGTVQDNEYTNTWRILYQFNDVFDKAIHIYNMGIFFVRIFINGDGDLFGSVQITNSRVNAKYFQYKLEVGNKSTFVCYEGKVLGSRTASENSPGLFVHNSFIQQLLQKRKSYECNLRITLVQSSPRSPRTKSTIAGSRKSTINLMNNFETSD